MSYSFRLADNFASFTSSRTNDLYQNWKEKLIFRGALYRLSGTGIVKKNSRTAKRMAAPDTAESLHWRLT